MKRYKNQGGLTMIYSKKIIFLSVLVSLFILSIFSCQSLGEKQTKNSNGSKPLRVLFIGNHLTSFWDFPLQVETLALELGAEPGIETEASTRSAVGLTHHISPEYSDTLHIIRTGGFDIVVIQGSISYPVEYPEKFLKNALVLANEAKAVGAEVVFYETWVYDPKGTTVKLTKIYEKSWSGGNPGEMQGRVRKAYTRAASEAGGRMARVGDAWEKVLSEHPKIKLHNSTGGAPSECGNYLAACVFVNVLTNLDPRDAKWRPEGVSEDEAIVLRVAAWEVGQEL